MKALWTFIPCLALFGILLSACERPIGTTREKPVDIDTLVASLEKDSLFRRFDGYLISPRGVNSYLFEGPDSAAFYWVTYDSRGPNYMRIRPGTWIQIDSQSRLDSCRDKAYELITIMKRLGIQVINSQKGFVCGIDDSLSLIHHPDTSAIELDPRFFEDQRRVNKDFVVYK